jgi:hypothetical protein
MMKGAKYLILISLIIASVFSHDTHLRGNDEHNSQHHTQPQEPEVHHHEIHPDPIRHEETAEGDGWRRKEVVTISEVVLDDTWEVEHKASTSTSTTFSTSTENGFEDQAVRHRGEESERKSEDWRYSQDSSSDSESFGRFNRDEEGRGEWREEASKDPWRHESESGSRSSSWSESWSDSDDSRSSSSSDSERERSHRSESSSDSSSSSSNWSGSYSTSTSGSWSSSNSDSSSTSDSSSDSESTSTSWESVHYRHRSWSGSDDSN